MRKTFNLNENIWDSWRIILSEYSLSRHLILTRAPDQWQLYPIWANTRLHSKRLDQSARLLYICYFAQFVFFPPAIVFLYLYLWFGKTWDQVCMLSVVHISGPCTYYTLRHKKFPSRAFAFAQNENLSNCRRTNYTSHCHLKKIMLNDFTQNQIQITSLLFSHAFCSKEKEFWRKKKWSTHSFGLAVLANDFNHQRRPIIVFPCQ